MQRYLLPSMPVRRRGRCKKTYRSILLRQQIGCFDFASFFRVEFQVVIALDNLRQFEDQLLFGSSAKGNELLAALQARLFSICNAAVRGQTGKEIRSPHRDAAGH